MAGYPGSLRRPMQDWRDAVWRAVPEGAEPERFAARRAFLLAHVAAGRARARPRLRRRRLRRRAAGRRLRGDDGRRGRRGAAARPRAGAGGGGGRSSWRARRCRSPRMPSTSCGRARCSSTWPTSSGCWPRCAACCAGAGRCWRRRRGTGASSSAPTRTSIRAPTTCASSARGPCARVLADAGFASAACARGAACTRARLAPARWSARRSRAAPALWRPLACR